MKTSLFIIFTFFSLNVFSQDTDSNIVALPKTFFQAGSELSLYYETVNENCVGTFILPNYSLGNSHLGEYLLKNTKQPGFGNDDNRLIAEGPLIVSFVVNKSGKIENINVVSSPHIKVTQNITETIGKLKDFTPAKCNNTPIALRIYFAVNFINNLK